MNKRTEKWTFAYYNIDIISISTYNAVFCRKSEYKKYEIEIEKYYM